MRSTPFERPGQRVRSDRCLTRAAPDGRVHRAWPLVSADVIPTRPENLQIISYRGCCGFFVFTVAFCCFVTIEQVVAAWRGSAFRSRARQLAKNGTHLASANVAGHSVQVNACFQRSALSINGALLEQESWQSVQVRRTRWRLSSAFCRVVERRRAASGDSSSAVARAGFRVGAGLIRAAV